MGPRRRVAVPSAAALPSARLPLGTPQPCSSTAAQYLRNSTPASPCSFLRRNSSSEDRGDATTAARRSHSGKHSLSVAPGAADASQAMSIAQAKLERQRKRIEDADAALNAHLSPDRRHQASRSKGGKHAQQSSVTSTAFHNAPGAAGGVPVSEVRVNTFRPATHSHIPTRSLSSLSHRTGDTAPSDMDFNDPNFDDDGFKIFKSRRNRKNFGGFDTFDDTPEARQSTVEAPIDTREVYDVFGNALPGPEFMEEHPGAENGQVQFIQHPNGDISAHQWSEGRYMWENIGQFSNIRKKIEGQLASDRLKGETARQTLQQNTLAYFRTIAKQREASVMGTPFGPKEVHYEMQKSPAPPPQPRHEPSKAPPGFNKLSGGDSQSTWRAGDFDEENEAFPTRSRFPQGLRGPPPQDATSPRHIPASRFPSMEPLSHPLNYPHQLGGQEDPFYSRSPYQYVYSNRYPHAQSHYPPVATNAPLNGRPIIRMPQQQPGFNSDFQFPPTGYVSRMPPIPTRPPGIAYHAPPGIAYRAPLALQTDQTSQFPARNPGYSAFAPSHHVSNNYPNVQPPRGYRHVQPASNIAAPIPRTIPNFGSMAAFTSEHSVHQFNLQDKMAALPSQTPLAFGNLGSRLSMSDQLWKISETAKERNLSQTSISRTVLYDPFQNPSTSTKGVESDGKDDSYIFNKTVEPVKALQPPSSLNSNSSRYFPTGLAPQIKLPASSSPVHRSITNDLRDSSPDTHWSKKPYDHRTPMTVVPSSTEPTPQNFDGPFFPADKQPLPVGASSSKKKTYDEELHDWWTSGNRFSRQQAFFDSIVAADRASNDGLPSNATQHPTPIGPPSRSSSVSFNQSTTRLLIPVLENLASYLQGPLEKRRDYFCQWSAPPDWAVDRTPGGNDSFYDQHWGLPPARLARDPRYAPAANRTRLPADRPLPQQQQQLRAPAAPPGLNNRFAPQQAYSNHMLAPVGSGFDARFSFAGSY